MGTGYAPYEEAAAKGQARVSLMQRLGQIFAGAGQGIAASQNAQNPFEAGALGFAGGYGQANAARQAAEAYAMKKIEAERANEQRQLERLNIESQIKAREKPEPPPKPSNTQTQYDELIRLGHSPKEARQLVYGLLPSEQTAKEIAGRKPEKPEKPRSAVQDTLDLIATADVNNPEHRARLERIIANPLSPEIGKAAQERLRIGGREFYRYQPVGPDSSQTGGLRYR